MRYFLLILCLSGFLGLIDPTFSYATLPTAEKLPLGLGAPLTDLTSTPTGIYLLNFGDYKNKYLFTWQSTELLIVDLETWSLATTQPDDFLTTIQDVKVLGDGKTVVVGLSSGDLATFDLSDTTTFLNTGSGSADEDTDEDDDETTNDDEDNDSRLVDISENMDTPGLTALAVSDNEDSSAVYIIDENNEMYYEANLSNANIEAVRLGNATLDDDDDDDDDETDYTPAAIAFSTTGSGKIIITTQQGVVLVASEGSTSFEEITLEPGDTDDSDPQLSEVVISPDSNFAYIIDSANDVIWVYKFSSESFIDQITGDTSLDPIQFDGDDENLSLSSIAFIQDPTGTETYGYVSGDFGVSVFDATDPGSSASDKRIDILESTSTVFDPITLSSTPSLLAAFSNEALTLLAANSNASVSVISNNPFVDIVDSESLTLTETESTFTLTFQSDKTGTYEVYANSDPLKTTGTELISETSLDSADTDTTTTEIDINAFDRDLLVEGENKFFVFVEDDSGFLGWDARLISIDRPPEPVDIKGANFGHQKIYASIALSPDADISHYTLLAQTSESQTSPVCPGTIDFENSGVQSQEIEAEDCNDNTCEVVITGLANGITYCLGATVTDNAGQTSTVSTFATHITPEFTTGPASFLGETGCSLNQKALPKSLSWIFCVFFLPLVLFRFFHKKHKSVLIIVALFFLMPASKAEAKFKMPFTPTFEFKGTYWMPTRDEIKPFLEGCCNLLGELEGGLIYKNQFHLTLGAGIGYRSNQALGLNSGLESSDRFKLLIIPTHLNFAYRFHYKNNQFLVPYVKAGIDQVIFRESGLSETLVGTKWGVHGGLGLSFLLDNIQNLGDDLSDSGINDLYLVLEGRYAQINNFNTTGMDFSGFYTSLGFLLVF